MLGPFQMAECANDRIGRVVALTSERIGMAYADIYEMQVALFHQINCILIGGVVSTE